MQGDKHVPLEYKVSTLPLSSICVSGHQKTFLLWYSELWDSQRTFLVRYSGLSDTLTEWQSYTNQITVLLNLMTNLHMADPYVFHIWKRPGDKLFFFFLILLETGRHHDTERQTDRQKHTHTHTHTHTWKQTVNKLTEVAELWYHVLGRQAKKFFHSNCHSNFY